MPKQTVLNPKACHNVTAKKGNFLSKDEVGGIDGIKHHEIMRKKVSTF